MSVSSFFENLIQLALIPFTDAVLFEFCAGILIVGQLFYIVYRLMKL